MIKEEIENTGSSFIKCNATPRLKKFNFVYSLVPKEIAVDEYNIIADKCSSQADFEVANKGCLRFTRVDGNYLFGDRYPFTESNNREQFQSLKQARQKEIKIRNIVRRVVYPVLL